MTDLTIGTVLLADLFRLDVLDIDCPVLDTRMTCIYKQYDDDL